jgi:hypothetical protein
MARKTKPRIIGRLEDLPVCNKVPGDGAIAYELATITCKPLPGQRYCQQYHGGVIGISGDNNPTCPLFLGSHVYIAAHTIETKCGIVKAQTPITRIHVDSIQSYVVQESKGERSLNL